jgi:hypothetical protein
MEDPVYTSLAPRNLVMTPDACFYCGADDPNWVQIERMFGLKMCDLHAGAALRDCRAYLHSKKMVRFADAYEHPILGQLLRMIKSTSFSVLRSSGEFQAGWTLNDDTFDMNTFILYNTVDGDWSIPVRLVQGDQTITKYTPIFNLKMTNMFPADLIDEAVFCLVDGVYFKEYEELQALGGPAEAPKDPNIIEVMYDGQPTRIFMPPPLTGAVAAAQAEMAAENPC